MDFSLLGTPIDSEYTSMLSNGTDGQQLFEDCTFIENNDEPQESFGPTAQAENEDDINKPDEPDKGEHIHYDKILEEVSKATSQLGRCVELCQHLKPELLTNYKNDLLLANNHIQNFQHSLQHSVHTPREDYTGKTFLQLPFLEAPLLQTQQSSDLLNTPYHQYTRNQHHTQPPLKQPSATQIPAASPFSQPMNRPPSPLRKPLLNQISSQSSISGLGHPALHPFSQTQGHQKNQPLRTAQGSSGQQRTMYQQQIEQAVQRQQQQQQQQHHIPFRLRRYKQQPYSQLLEAPQYPAIQQHVLPHVPPQQHPTAQQLLAPPQQHPTAQQLLTPPQQHPPTQSPQYMPQQHLTSQPQQPQAQAQAQAQTQPQPQQLSQPQQQPQQQQPQQQQPQQQQPQQQQPQQQPQQQQPQQQQPQQQQQQQSQQPLQQPQPQQPQEQPPPQLFRPQLHLPQKQDEKLYSTSHQQHNSPSYIGSPLDSPEGPDSSSGDSGGEYDPGPLHGEEEAESISYKKRKSPDFEPSKGKPYANNIRVFKVNPSKSRAHCPSAPHNPVTTKPSVKVPSSLSNTMASSMMYQFNLKKPKGKRSRKGVIASSAPPLPLNLNDFEMLTVLGVGTYGKVHLVRFKPENTLYCLKQMKQYTIFRHKQVEHIQNEKTVLSSVKCAGIIRLFATASDQIYVYLLQEYVPGGELFTHIRRMGKLPLATAKFFAAEIVLILEYLHSKNIIYRDLKPENVLLDAEGHVKLTDFGFAKYVIDRTWTICGTPDYLAPEIISGHGHCKAVDWWSLGVLSFEMLAGFPPFTDENRLDLFAKLREPEKLVYPEFFTPESIDFIKRLLVPDPTRRLGLLRRGVLDIKLHPFFTGIDWNGITERKVPTPIKLNLKNVEDTSYYTEGNEVQQDAMALNDVPDNEQDVPIPQKVQEFFDSF